MSGRLHLAPMRTFVVGVATVAVLLPSSPASWASTAAGHRHHSVVRVAPGPLSGKWSGSYKGTFNGTFKLTWQELRAHLSGTITISNAGSAPNTTSLSGAVKGRSITFGTVGTEAVTYSGSFSANSMAGTWKIQAGGRSLGGGSWRASRA